MAADTSAAVWHATVWRSNTHGCQLTNDNTTVEMSDAVADDASHRPSVVCMSASSSVQSGHSVSFHIGRSHANTAADEPMLSPEHDGVGLSVSDEVAMDTDDVIFYSFHGNVTLMAHIPVNYRILIEAVRCSLVTGYILGQCWFIQKQTENLTVRHHITASAHLFLRT